MRPSSWLPLLLPLTAATALAACKGDTKTLNPIVPAQSRNAPITPGDRQALTNQAGTLQGSNCSPSSTGPAVCQSSNPSCTATFDSNGELTHLLCTLDSGYTFDCTRPCPNIFECTWSDRPNCADLYNASSGVFQGWQCDSALAGAVDCHGHDGGSGPDTGSTCHGLDEQTCTATPGCVAEHCPGCNGQQTYEGCGNPGDPVACPGITCPACQGLNEQQCMADTNCSPGYCPDCNGHNAYVGCFLPNQPHDCAQPPPNCHQCSGLTEAACVADTACRANYCDQCGAHNFVSCTDPTAPPPPCPAIPCPACTGLDEASCSANAGCHPVYNDPNTCACAPLGCCIQFSHCAVGANADCVAPQGAPMCGMAPPVCEGENGYVVAYANGCYDGCVHARECGGSPAYCAGAMGNSFPSFSNTCQTDMDCYLAIHQTDCCGSMRALGIVASEQVSFRNDEAICESEYPGCGCASQGILADDGQRTLDSSRVHVRCSMGTAGGSTCMTYVQ
jgi:hypothetical protein